MASVTWVKRWEMTANAGGSGEDRWRKFLELGNELDIHALCKKEGQIRLLIFWLMQWYKFTGIDDMGHLKWIKVYLLEWKGEEVVWKRVQKSAIWFCTLEVLFSLKIPKRNMK